MRVKSTKDGVTLRVIAGTNTTILGIDLESSKRKGCLGFSIRRFDLGPVGKPFSPAERKERWLPNMLKFPSDPTDPEKTAITTLTAPLQKFSWTDNTCSPGFRYRYQVVPRYGRHEQLTPANITPDMSVTVEVATEDNANPATQVFFNRGAAASKAFEDKFGKVIKTEAQLLADTEIAKSAKAWLSRGLEEAALAFLNRAKDKNFRLHAAVYEFQKPELLQGIAAAAKRGAGVEVVYHHRIKDDKDTTAEKNDAAIHLTKLPPEIVVQRKCNPQNAIMHNKFVVLLEKSGGEFKPISVLTGSMNFTDGAVYGQLNVGHVINDATVAKRYDDYWKLLRQDLDASHMKHEVDHLTPVSPTSLPAHGVTPIFSPQTTDDMLRLYSAICARSRCVFVSAPFALSGILLSAFEEKASASALRFFLLDKESCLGTDEEVTVIENDPHNSIGIAVTLPSALHDFQGHLLEGKEGFRHAGVHIHSKIILADPLGPDPILIMGSANFSHGSTRVNDSNSVVFRGDTAVADIYASEFMRVFGSYHFRAWRAHKLTKLTKPASGEHEASSDTLGLQEDDSWSEKYYVAGSQKALERMMFAGTM